jgi:hypothetical protein
MPYLSRDRYRVQDHFLTRDVSFLFGMGNADLLGGPKMIYLIGNNVMIFADYRKKIPMSGEFFLYSI